jgi:hypothetical protein
LGHCEERARGFVWDRPADHIRASSQTAAFKGRIHGCTRTLRRKSDSSCTAGAVHTWPIAAQGVCQTCLQLVKADVASAAPILAGSAGAGDASAALDVVASAGTATRSSRGKRAAALRRLGGRAPRHTRAGCPGRPSRPCRHPCTSSPQSSRERAFTRGAAITRDGDPWTYGRHRAVVYGRRSGSATATAGLCGPPNERVRRRLCPEPLANATRRLLRGELQREGWTNVYKLMIHRPET